jgi:hypothetical protein
VACIKSTFKRHIAEEVDLHQLKGEMSYLAGVDLFSTLTYQISYTKPIFKMGQSRQIAREQPHGSKRRCWSWLVSLAKSFLGRSFNHNFQAMKVLRQYQYLASVGFNLKAWNF